MALKVRCFALLAQVLTDENGEMFLLNQTFFK